MAADGEVDVVEAFAELIADTPHPGRRGQRSASALRTPRLSGVELAEGEDPIARLADSESRALRLSLLLQDKCEEVLDLTAQVDKLEAELKALRQQVDASEDNSELLKKLEAANARNDMLAKCVEEYEEANKMNQSLISELRRRSETMAVILETQILNPADSVSSSPLASAADRQSAASSIWPWGGKRLQQLQQQQSMELQQLHGQFMKAQIQLAAAEEKISNMETQMKMEGLTRQTLERQVREWEAKYILEADQLRNARASIEAYESKLKAVEKGAKDNLEHQGRLHRRDKETLRKLNKKIEELQFLLDERDDDSESDEEFDDSSSSSDDEKK